MGEATYYTPTGGLPPQTQLLSDRAMFREAYAVIPRGTNSDIVTSYLPHWQGTRLWVLARPLSGFAETFSQYMMEVSPGGGSDRPEPDPEAEGEPTIAVRSQDDVGQVIHVTVQVPDDRPVELSLQERNLLGRGFDVPDHQVVAPWTGPVQHLIVVCRNNDSTSEAPNQACELQTFAICAVLRAAQLLAEEVIPAEA